MTVNTKFQNKEIKKGLYIIPTPIGNLGDITYRAIEILKKSDFILCEDTRISRKVMEKFEVKTKLLSNHKFNEKKNLSLIINHLRNDKIISLVSDAGTPGISDPGAILVRECVKEKINIFPLPGPSAVSTAVSISGFSEKYFFYGFFPSKLKDIKNDLKLLSNLKGVEQKFRNAKFRTYISFCSSENEFWVDGSIEGEITEKPLGENGFGYDSVFLVKETGLTFGQMDKKDKDKISHRGLALKRMISLLEQNIN